jgi:hypothetical protein
MRTFVCTVCALLIFAIGLIAAEIKGKVKSVDADKMVITVTADGKDQEVQITDDTKLLNTKGDPHKDREKALKQLKKLKEGANVTVTTEKKGAKQVATEIKFGGGKKKDK